MLSRPFAKTFLISAILALITFLGFIGWQEILALNTRYKTIESRLNAIQKYIATQSSGSSETIQEFQNRQAVIQKSQDQLLTSAVARAAPSVVSIVISQEVPKLEISYENPFGNDPFFKDFGFKIPIYKYSGKEREQIGAGSGFIISTSGYVLTNRHVVENTTAKYSVLLSNGQSMEAQVAYIDKKKDVAVLKIDGQYPHIASLGNSNSIRLGQTVVAIGNALGEYNNSVSVGIVSGLNRNVQASALGSGAIEELDNVIQTDAAINPGNSGGPLIDLEGNVVGINVATVVGSNNISFAIPINSIKTAIANFIQ